MRTLPALVDDRVAIETREGTEVLDGPVAPKDLDASMRHIGGVNRRDELVRVDEDPVRRPVAVARDSRVEPLDEPSEQEGGCQRGVRVHFHCSEGCSHCRELIDVLAKGTTMSRIRGRLEERTMHDAGRPDGVQPTRRVEKLLDRYVEAFVERTDRPGKGTVELDFRGCEASRAELVLQAPNPEVVGGGGIQGPGHEEASEPLSTAACSVRAGGHGEEIGVRDRTEPLFAVQQPDAILRCSGSRDHRVRTDVGAALDFREELSAAQAAVVVGLKETIQMGICQLLAPSSLQGAGQTGCAHGGARVSSFADMGEKVKESGLFEGTTSAAIDGDEPGSPDLPTDCLVCRVELDEVHAAANCVVGNVLGKVAVTLHYFDGGFDHGCDDVAESAESRFDRTCSCRAGAVHEHRREVRRLLVEVPGSLGRPRCQVGASSLNAIHRARLLGIASQAPQCQSLPHRTSWRRFLPRSESSWATRTQPGSSPSGSLDEE